MLTEDQVRDNLEQIRTYYSMKDVFDKAPTEIRAECFYDMLERYHSVMRNAPAKLYVLYVGLYVNNTTQVVIAEDWNYTKEHIKDMNKKLVEYLVTKLNQQTVS